ncbi:MAG: hypothetical protein IT261_08345 [Saprospiraceae bacterium]|nr:hypothetical protein [Saprospiraceae bacterium]
MKIFYFTATKWAFGAIALGIFSLASCEKHDHTENENITKVDLKLTGAGFNQVFSAIESNGDGIWDVIQPITIPAGVTPITCEVFVYDITQTPIKDLTTEIVEEGAEHFFTYTISGVNVTVVAVDKDSNNQPIGQNTSWTIGSASNGTVQVKLFHEPSNKNNSSDPGGEVDFDITFPVTIQ